MKKKRPTIPSLKKIMKNVEAFRQNSMHLAKKEVPKKLRKRTGLVQKKWPKYPKSPEFKEKMRVKNALPCCEMGAGMSQKIRVVATERFKCSDTSPDNTRIFTICVYVSSVLGRSSRLATGPQNRHVPRLLGQPRLCLSRRHPQPTPGTCKLLTVIWMLGHSPIPRRKC